MDHAQQEAPDKVKEAVMSTPVLRYYTINEEVTLQCDRTGCCYDAKWTTSARALTPAETRYAQIEKELLAVVFACDHFDAYIYGRNKVHIETDHRIHSTKLQLQKYDLEWKYKKGTSMFLADTLSWAHLPDVYTCDQELSTNLESIDHTAPMLLAVNKDRLMQIRHASTDNPILQVLRKTIQQGWPENTTNVPLSIWAYFDFHDELIVQGATYCHSCSFTERNDVNGACITHWNRRWHVIAFTGLG